MRRLPAPAALVALLAPLLGSCTLVTAQPGDNGTTIYGVRVMYTLKPKSEFVFCSAQAVGCSIPLGGICVVQLSKEYWDRGTPWQRVNLVAHEVGHCLDLRALSLSHGGFTNEGGRWGAYWSAPFEGYAEAYARSYIAKCGLDLDSLGWMNRRGSCTPPDPREVTPDSVQKRNL